MQSRWTRALRIAALAGVTGFGAGLIITAIAGAMGGVFYLWLPLFFAAAAAVSGYLIGAIVIEGAGDLAGRLYGGGHVGTKPEYSRAQALSVRGDHEGAVKLFEAEAEAHPDDPEPLILGARVLRDALGDHGRAVAWLRRARAIPRLERSADVIIARELVDLYDGPLQEPRKAIPELARIAEAYPDTTAGEWAGRQLARLRTRIWDDVKEIQS
jgi:hypothetical protein